MLTAYDLVAFVFTSDAARAKTFYEKTLGLTFVSQDESTVVFDAHGTQLRLVIMAEHTPTEHPVVGLNVPDIAVAAADLVSAGVTFETYPYLEQDELGIWHAPDGGVKLAFFKDPDGNVLSIAQH